MAFKLNNTFISFELNIVFILIFSILLGSCKSSKPKEDSTSKNTTTVGWEKAEQIISSLSPPKFPNKDFSILEFGAIADGNSFSTQAFADAIKACNEAGGGRVVVPSGEFLTGPIHLKSNVNLHLEEGAVVKFSQNPKDYLPTVHTSYEGVELMNYSPLIYAYNQENIAVTGLGTFDGQANEEHWWPWSGKDVYGWKEGQPKQSDENTLPALRKMNEEQVPVEERQFGENHYFRPLFFQPFGCENVYVQGVTFINGPFWMVHPIKCTNVIVDGITVKSHGPNNDGCDPEYSKNVWIKNCLFDTGDDCIAIKSGRNNDGRRVNIPSENIVVENCTMKDGHGGVVMGSEISAGVRNVFVRNCSMDSPNLDRAIRIKTNTLRGGFVENIFVKNVTVGQVKEAFLRINTRYGTYDNQEGEFMPNIQDIYIEDCTAKTGGKYGILIEGQEENKVKNINFKNVTIDHIEEGIKIENCEPIHFTNTILNNETYDIHE